MTEEKHTCECTVYRKLTSFKGERRPCGKPAKGQLQDGKWACGIHLTTERKRLEKYAAETIEIEADDEYINRLKFLSEKFGLELGRFYNPINHRYHRDLTLVNIDDLLRVLGCEE